MVFWGSCLIVEFGYVEWNVEFVVLNVDFVVVRCINVLFNVVVLFVGKFL